MLDHRPVGSLGPEEERNEKSHVDPAVRGDPDVCILVTGSVGMVLVSSTLSRPIDPASTPGELRRVPQTAP